METSQVSANPLIQLRRRRRAFYHAQVKILEKIAEGSPLEEILERIVLMIEEQIQGICSILLLDKDKGQIVHGAAPHLPAEYLKAIDGTKIGPQEGSCGTAAYLGQRVVVEDIATHPYWAKYKEFALPHELKACWSSPIFSPAHEVLGTFAVYYNTPRGPRPNEIRWVDEATHLASVALMKTKNETSLRQSEAKYRQIMETSHEGVISINLEGKITFANPRTLNILGFSQQEIIGKSIFDFLDSKEQQKVEAMLAHPRLGLSDQYELQLKSRDEKEISVIVATSPIFDDEGLAVGVLGMITDITERKRAETLLRISEAEFRTMFEGATIPMAIVDSIFRPIKVNPSLEKLLGFSAEEFEKNTLLELIHPEDLLQSLEKKRRMEMGEFNSYQLEIRMRQKSGEFTWVRIAISYIHSTNGAKQKAMVIIENIAEIKEYEKELQAAERMRSLLFDSVGDVLFYIVVEPDFRYRFMTVNGSFLKATGLTQDQVVGRYVEEVIPNPSLSMVLGKYRRACETRTPVSWDEVSEYPSGQKYGEVTVNPVFDDEGKCKGLIGSVHDITDRKLSEDRIAAQAALLDHAHDAILLRNLDGVILYWNQGASKLYGWAIEEAMGHNVRDLIYRDAKAFDEIHKKVLEDGQWEGEITQYTKDGRKITIEGSWTLMRDSQNQPQAILAINTDVTEKKRLQEQITLSQRMESLGTLAGGIAHDFNNLLTAILGHIGMAESYIPDDHKAQKNLSIATSACMRAAELVRRIMTFSRRPELARSELQIQNIVEETVQLLRSTLPAMIQIQTTWQPDIPLISGNSTQIQQVVMNLATNSIQAMGDHGSLNLNLETSLIEKPVLTNLGPLSAGRYVKLTVSDSGIGMSEETLKRIFDPFFTTKPPGRGTGLGLSVVQGIVKDYGGGIIVTSQVNQGTKFEVYFPALSGPRKASAQKEVQETPMGHGQYILYIDDEASILALGANVLEGYGYRVASFLDPLDALHAFQANPSAFNAVITDFAMPHISGIEVAQKILEIRPDMPVILTSGFIREKDEAYARKLGVREILQKPNTITEMIQVLGRVFN